MTKPTTNCTKHEKDWVQLGALSHHLLDVLVARKLVTDASTNREIPSTISIKLGQRSSCTYNASFPRHSIL